MSQGEITTDHAVIRQWIEERGGRPTRVQGTEGEDGEGILRVDFAEPDEQLEEISWEEFFDTFEDRELGFLHQDRTADGSVSRFFKFIHRPKEPDGGATGRRGSSSSKGERNERERSSASPQEKGMQMAKDTEHRGQVKDPEHDGRLKENREAGRTKETTPASAARAQSGGSHSSGSSHSSGGASHSGGSSHSSGGASHSSGSSHTGAAHSGGSHSQASSHESGGSKQSGGQRSPSSGGSDDLKSREYRDEKGEVHHHTRTHTEQHNEKK